MVQPAKGPDGTRGRRRGPGTAAVSEWRELSDYLLRGYPDALCDHDLLTMTLTRVCDKTARAHASLLLSRFGSFANVVSAPMQLMQSIPELSSDGLALLLLIRAAALRSLRGEIDKFDVLDNPQTVVDYLHAKLSRDPIVRTYVLLLNGSNRLITAEELQRGTVDHVEVYPRDVMKRCLETGATGVILAQNHPGGDPLPTDSDKEVTRLIAIAAYPLSIKLLDHVVIGNGRWYSFQAHGLLDAITRSPSVVQVPHSGRCTDHSRAHLYGQRRWFDCDYPDD